MLNVNSDTKEKRRRLSLFSILKTVGCCYVLMIICIALVSLAVRFTPLPESVAGVIVMLLSVLLIAVSGAVTALGTRSMGWLCGGICGVVYVAALFALVSAVFWQLTFSTGVLIMLIIGFFAGAIGGIIGINLQ